MRSDLAIFTAWCTERALRALPATPDTLAAFVDAMASARAPSTVRRYVASIAAAHRAIGARETTGSAPVRRALARMHRRKGRRQAQAQCCFLNSPVGSPRELTALFRRRIGWDDGTIRDAAGAGVVALLMNRSCRSGEDVGARAASVGKGWASAQHLSRPCPHGP